VCACTSDSRDRRLWFHTNSVRRLSFPNIFAQASEFIACFSEICM
jgi:hypothetical protein